MLESEMAREMKVKYKHCNFTRIETGQLPNKSNKIYSISPGVCDWHVRSATHDTFVEYKQFEWPRRLSTDITIPFRKTQMPWIRRHIRLGGQCMLIVTVHDIYYIIENGNIWPKYTQAEFTKKFSFQGRIEELPASLFLKGEEALRKHVRDQ